jgi:hypothetical protein
MPILTQPAFGPRTALAYVTGGTLLVVWTLVWYFTRDHTLARTEWFWVSGFFLTGLTFVILGFALGPLGRAARQAELPPSEAIAAEANIQRTAAANPNPVVTPTPAAPVTPAAPAAPVAPATAPQAPPPGTVVQPPPTFRTT